MNIELKDLIRAIRESHGSISKTAILLRISRKTLYAHLNKSPQLRAAMDEIVKICRDEKAKERHRKVYSDSTRIISMNVKESDTSLLLSTKMQRILYQTKGNYTSIYNLAIDQLNLRELMSFTTTIYNNHEINFKEYLILMNQLHRTYGQITVWAEAIAKTKLEGKTPTQVYDSVFHFIRNILETFKELIADKTIKRSKMVDEFERRIKIKEDVKDDA